MELPDIVYLLIGIVGAGAALIVIAMHRRRDHALRDRFAEEYDRVLHEHATTGRSRRTRLSG